MLVVLLLHSLASPGETDGALSASVLAPGTPLSQWVGELLSLNMFIRWVPSAAFSLVSRSQSSILLLGKVA